MKKIGEVIGMILEEYKQRAAAFDISPNTLRAAKNSFSKLNSYWGDKKPTELTKENWAKFQIEFDEQFHETMFNCTKYAVVLARVLHEKGLIKQKPQIKNCFARRERDARRKKKNWLLTDKEVDSLLKACETDKERLAIQLGSRLAFRISDVVRLSWERIVLVGGENKAYIEFKGSDDKASFVGNVPLPDELVELLLRIDKQGPWVFPQARNPQTHLITQQFRFNEIKKRAGVKRGGFHDLRRYRLSLDFKNPKLTPALVCKMRRISLPVAMENYIRTNEDDMALMLKESK